MDKTMRPPGFDGGMGNGHVQVANAAAVGRGAPLQLVQPGSVAGIQANALGGSMNQCEHWRWILLWPFSTIISC